MPTNEENGNEQTIAKCRQAEKTLTKNGAFKRDLFSSMTDMFAALDIIYFTMELTYDKAGKPVDGIFCEVNPATERLLGKSREQLIGKSRKELFGNVFDELPKKFDVVIKTGKPSHFEGYGSALQKYYDIYSWKIAENQVSAILRDISENKKAEEALKQSEERFSKAFFGNQQAMAISELDGKLIEVNSKFELLFGVGRQKLIGHFMSDFLEYGDRSKRERTLKLLNEGKEVEDEQTYFLPNGKKIDTTYFTQIIVVNGKNRLVGTWQDITERKKAEEALSRLNQELEERVQKRTQEVSSERQRLYKVLETLPAYVVLLDKDYRMPFANKVFREIFGESHGRRCHEFLFGRDSECENCETYKVLKTNKPQQWAWTGPNGHDYEIYDYPFVEADGSVLILEMGLDVTKRKKAEREAQEAAKKLKDAERLAAIGATAGMVGHDIRNPLQAITGDLYLAKTELATLPENEQKLNALENLEEIEHNIDYINKIVADLQDYARPLKPRAQETDVESVFNEVLGKNGIPKNIKVSVEIEDKAKRILADPDYLKRIASNLTLNAIQAMPDGGKLTIHAYTDKKTNDVLIKVKDTGVGISEDIKPKLFTPMITTKSKGQGFGLAVVKRMTEGLGGTVTFESTQGKGTTFTVRLPAPKS